MGRKRMTLCLLVATALASTAAAPAVQAADPAPSAAAAPRPSSVEKTTFEFAKTDGQTLSLDRRVDTSVQVVGKRPVIIYSFGGGWAGGARNDAGNIPFLNYLASLGYTVIAIDYRLGMKVAAEKKEATGDNGVALYLRAIDWGMTDLFDATAYVLKHADAWGIDKDRITIAGSSSGAVNSLTAEFNVANETELARKHLPAGFRYNGVIAMAGAFWLKANTPLAFKNKPAPILFFHGSKDQLVTYDEVQGPFSGYGPVAFFKKFPGPDYPKWFVDFPGGDHILAGSPMMDQRLEIAAFLQKLVKEKQQASIHTIEEGQILKTFGNMSKLYGDRLFTGADAPSPK